MSRFNLVFFVSLLTLHFGCKATSDLKKQLIGFYNIETMELAVDDNSIDYYGVDLLVFLEDQTCGIPLRDDLPIESMDKARWDLKKNKNGITLHISSEDSLFNDPFDLIIEEYYYKNGKPIALKEFTIVNQFVLIEVYR